MADVLKEARGLGWDHITLTKSKGFCGAVQTYKAGDGSDVALCFNLHEAFIIEDDLGLFDKDDLIDGVVKNNDIDVEESGEIEGLTLVAFEEDGEVHFVEEQLNRLGINDFSVKESITKRLKTLSRLDKLVDIPLG